MYVHVVVIQYIIVTCILHVYYLESSEVSSSNHMDKEGLHGVLEFVKEKDLKVGILRSYR